MSLKLWFPFNGNLDNSLMNEFKITNTSNLPTQDINGKLGKTYVFDGITNTADLNFNLTHINGNMFTITTWVKVNTTSVFNAIFSNIINGLEFNISSAGRPRIELINTSGVTFRAESTTSIAANEWYHIAITYNNGIVKFYINGAATSTNNIDTLWTTNTILKKSTTIFSFGRRGANYAACAINDFRFYDEALALKEIKEIYKTKIAHYNFNNINNSYRINKMPDMKPIYASAHSTHELTTEIDAPIPGYDVYKVIEDGVDGGTARYSFRFNADDYALWDREWTLSLYIFLPDLFSSRYTGTDIWCLQNSNGTDWHSASPYSTEYGYYGAGSIKTKQILFDNNKKGCWQRLSVTFKPDSSKRVLTTNNDPLEDNKYVAGYFRLTMTNSINGGTPYYLYLSCPQLEMGEEATNLILPNNVDNNICWDASGFNNNITITELNAPTLSKDTTTGTYSAKFNNIRNLYLSANINTLNTPNCSISLWFKKLDNAYYQGIIQMGSSRMMRLMAFGGDIIRFHPIGLASTQPYIDFNYQINTWYHIVATVTSNMAYLYVNGVKIGEVAIPYPISNYTPDTILIGRDASMSDRVFNGFINDVRVYATTLSENDAIELYKTKGSIDKNSKVYSSEIIEAYVAENSIFENIILCSRCSYTGGTTPYFSYKGSTIEWTSRGFMVIRIDKNLNLISNNSYVYYNNASIAQTMVDDIKAMNPTDYICVITNDEPNTYSSVIIDYFKSLGLNPSINYRGAYLAVFKNTGIIIEDQSQKYLDVTYTGCNILSTVKLTKNTTTVTKKSQFISNEINEIGNGIITLKESDGNTIPLYTEDRLGETWCRIFYHNNRAGTVLFANDDESKLTNVGKPDGSVDKYSIIDKIEQFRDTSGTFEFMITYPDLDSSAYNRWTQTSTPMETIAGYTAKTLSWTDNVFGGISVSSSTAATTFDCSPSSGGWYYAIGAKQAWSGGIPAYSPVTLTVVELWVKMDIGKLMNNLCFSMSKDGSSHAKEYIEI